MKKIRTMIVTLFVIGCFATGSGINPNANAQNKNKGPNSPGKSEKAKGAHKANHHNGKQLLGEKIKTNGNHLLDKKGDYTSTVDVKDGKVAGVHVKHAKNGDVAVTKYKTHMKVVQAGGPRFVYASWRFAQDEYLGTEWIGYGYID